MSFQQIAKYLFVTLLFASVTACTDWVRDDLSECPTGCYVHFEVAEELAKVGKTGVEGFAGEVNDITLFVFDEAGYYVNTFLIQGSELHQNNFTLTVELKAGKYQMLAWAGLSDANYKLPALTKGTSTMEELELTLLCDENNRLNCCLTPLWHGKPITVEVKSSEMNEVTIGMLKNTNTFVTILQDTSGKHLEGDTYSYEIVADNGRMAHDNTVLEDDPIYYASYHVETATVDASTIEMRNEDATYSLSVARAELNTLRLMKERPARFVVTEKATGKKILNINLTQYLLLVREQYPGQVGHNLTDQEYLDYENSHSIVFFLSPTGEVETPYLCLSLKINGWIVRLNDNIEL